MSVENRGSFSSKRVVHSLVNFREDRPLLKHHNGENGHAHLIAGEVFEAFEAWIENKHPNFQEAEFCDVAIYCINELLLENEPEKVSDVIDVVLNNAWSDASQYDASLIMSAMKDVSVRMKQTGNVEFDDLLLLLTGSFQMIMNLHPEVMDNYDLSSARVMQAMMEKIGFNNAQHSANFYQLDEREWEKLFRLKESNYTEFKHLVNESYEKGRVNAKKQAKEEKLEELFIYGWYGDED